MTRPAIQFSRLGDYGRFGNQLLQYAFCRAYAEAHGLALELPPWIGDRLFPNAAHDPLGSPLPLMWVRPNGKKSLDLLSYCDRQEHVGLYTREDARHWFEFFPEVAARFPKTRPWYVACHVRHGDTRQKTHFYPWVPYDAYRAALEEHGYDEADVIWVSEETAEPGEYGTLRDFFTLLHADVLFRGNSSFSWWAAELGDHEAVFAPTCGDRLGEQRDAKFAPGNHWKIYPKGTEMRLRRK